MTNQHRATDEQQKKAPHKVEPLAAAPSAWVQLEASAHTRDIYSSCLLELRDRIQQLEATQHAHITGPSEADIKAAELEWARTVPGMRSDDRMLALQDQIRDGALSLADALKEIGAPESAPGYHESASSYPTPLLVNKVAKAVNPLIPTARFADTFNAETEARAAIREVARWLRSELNSTNTADRLEQEANR